MNPKNTICLMYNKDAEEAVRFYASVFPDTKLIAIHKSPDDYPMGKKGDVLSVEFSLMGLPCVAINGGDYFKHSEAFSFQISTETQEETDRYWKAIVENKGSEGQCGWCKDRYGLSFQIIPTALTNAMMKGGEASERVFKAMMTMKKIDIKAIERARDKTP